MTRKRISSGSTFDPQAADFEPCWPVLRKYFGEVRPAATMLCAGLADPRMKIEIEVTALKQGRQ